MKTFIQTAIAVTVAAAAFGVSAQTSTVDLQNAKQSQSGGALNSQQGNIGNASGNGKSDVKANGVTQSQSGGALNSQKLSIANSSKGKSDVKATNVSQSQSGGALNSQGLAVGNTN